METGGFPEHYSQSWDRDAPVEVSSSDRETRGALGTPVAGGCGFLRGWLCDSGSCTVLQGLYLFGGPDCMTTQFRKSEDI